jgi:hypothetical protein
VKQNAKTKAAAAKAVKTEIKKSKASAKPAPVAPESAQPIGKSPKKARKANKSDAPAITVEVSKRVTPGAAIKEWRLRRSQRRAYQGFFVQGGHYSEANGARNFIVAVEERFSNLVDAKLALTQRQETLAKQDS